MKIECPNCYGGKFITTIEEQIVCDNCGVEIPLSKYEEMFAVGATVRITSNKRLSHQPSHDKQSKKVDLLIDHVKNGLQLNDSICLEIKYLFIKAYKQGYPRRLGTGRNTKHFYLTECLGACIYIAALQKIVASVR